MHPVPLSTGYGDDDLFRINNNKQFPRSTMDVPFTRGEILLLPNRQAAIKRTNCLFAVVLFAPELPFSQTHTLLLISSLVKSSEMNSK